MKNKKILSAVLAFSVIISQLSPVALADGRKRSLRQEIYIIPEAQVIKGGNSLDLSRLVKGDVKGEVSFSLDGNFDSVLQGSTLTSGYHKELVSVNVRIAPYEGKKEFYQENAIEVQVTDKKTDGLEINMEDSFFKEEADEPSFAFEGSEERRKVSYEGTTCDGRSYQGSEKPFRAGNYKVKAEVETSDTVYTGSSDFEILKKDISRAAVTAHSPKYDGESHRSEVISVVLDGEDITEFVDVDAVSHEDAGTYNFTVTAKENTDYTGRANARFTIRPKEITPCAEHIPDLVFTGSEQQPEIVLKDGNRILTEGKDYKVTFNNNMYVGKATAVIECLEGNYTFRPMEVDFNITIAQQSPYILNHAELPYGGSLDLEDLVCGFEGDFKFSAYSDLNCKIEDNVLTAGNKKGLIYIEAEAPALDLNGDGKYEYANFKEEDAVTVSVTDKKDGKLSFNKKSTTVPYLTPHDLKAYAEGGRIAYTFVDEWGDEVKEISEPGAYTVFASLTDEKLTGNAKAEVITEPLKVKARTSNEITKSYDGTADAGEVILSFDSGKNTISVVTEGRFTSEDVGRHKITIDEKDLKRDFPGYDVDVSDISGSITAMEAAASPVSYKEIKREYNGKNDLTCPDITLQIEGALGNIIEFEAVENKFADGRAAREKDVSFGRISGEGLENYNITLPQLKGEITEKPLIITPADVKKNYGEKDPAFPFEAEGIISGDALNITLSREKGEDAGTYLLELSDDIYAPDYKVLLHPKKHFLTIEKAVPFFDMQIYPVSAKPGEEIAVEITALNNAEGAGYMPENVLCRLGTEEISLKEEDGIYKGHYYIEDNESQGARRVFTASLREDKNYFGDEDILKSVTVTHKAVPQIYLEASDAVYGEAVKLKYEVQSQEEDLKGSLRLFIDNEEAEAPRSLKGEITLDENLDAGIHSIRLSFEGKKGFADGEKSVAVRVRPAELKLRYEGRPLQKNAEDREERFLDGTVILEGVREGDDVALAGYENLQTLNLGSLSQEGNFDVAAVRAFGDGFLLTGEDKDNYIITEYPHCTAAVTSHEERPSHEDEISSQQQEQLKFSLTEFLKKIFDKLFGR